MIFSNLLAADAHNKQRLYRLGVRLLEEWLQVQTSVCPQFFRGGTATGVRARQDVIL